jgi:hypothetical protein
MSEPNPVAKTRLLVFNVMQSRVVTDLLSGHNTLRRHLYIVELIDSPLRCGAEKETSDRVSCEFEDLATLILNLDSVFLDLECVRSLRGVWNFIREEVCHELDKSLRGTKVLKGLCVLGSLRARTHYALHSILEVKRLQGMPDRFYTENL